MESIIYKSVNKAIVQRDKSKIESLGNFAVLLSKILQYAEKNKIDSTYEPLTLYRGINRIGESFEDFEFARQAGKKINMRGYLSMTTDKDKALQAAFDGPPHGEAALIEMRLP